MGEIATIAQLVETGMNALGSHEKRSLGR